MTKTKNMAGHDKISSALKKLKDESNAKELQLIELIANIYESMHETKEKAIDKVRDTAGSVNTSVHLHPWYYIGGAAVVGFLTAFFIRR